VNEARTRAQPLLYHLAALRREVESPIGGDSMKSPSATRWTTTRPTSTEQVPTPRVPRRSRRP